MRPIEHAIPTPAEAAASGRRPVAAWFTAVAASMSLAAVAAVLAAAALADTPQAMADCPPGRENSPACVEQRENLAEERLEEMIENPVPPAEGSAARPPGDAAATEQEPAVGQVGVFPQIRVPLDEAEPAVEVKPNPEPADVDPVPPPHDAGERGLDPLIE